MRLTSAGSLSSTPSKSPNVCVRPPLLHPRKSAQSRCHRLAEVCERESGIDHALVLRILISSPYVDHDIRVTAMSVA